MPSARKNVLLSLAVVTIALGVAAGVWADYTLEFSAISSGGTALGDGTVLVVGQPIVGLMTDTQSTLHAGIVPCFGGHPGDLNCDGVVDFDDINPFILTLSDPAAYVAAYPNCNILNGDCDHDGDVDFDDINAFVGLLSG